MIFVEISDKNKMMLLEYEDKGQHFFVTAIKMQWFNIVEGSFWHEKTGTKNLNSCQEIK